MLCVSLCGGATVFQGTPGFSRGEVKRRYHGVTESHSFDILFCKYTTRIF